MRGRRGRNKGVGRNDGKKMLKTEKEKCGRGRREVAEMGKEGMEW